MEDPDRQLIVVVSFFWGIYGSILPRIEIVAADWKINRYFFGSGVHLPVNKLGVD